MALQTQPARIDTSTDARGHSRRRLSLEVGARAKGRCSPLAQVHNISETGVLIEAEFALAIGDAIEVDLPRVGLRMGEIVWSSDRFFGCKFTDELNTAAVSASVLRGSFVSLAPAAEVRHSFQAQLDRYDQTAVDEGTGLTLRSRVMIVAAAAAFLWTVMAVALWAVLS